MRNGVGTALPDALDGESPETLDAAFATLARLAEGGTALNLGALLGGAAPAEGDAGRLARGEGEESRLRLAEARYRSLIEQIPAVTFLASLAGGQNDIYVSPQIEALLGFTQAEWISDPILWYRQIHPEDRAKLSLEFATACLT